MNRTYKYMMLFPLGLPLLLCSCFTASAKNERLAYIGSTVITQQDADAFGTVTRFFPNPPEEFSIAAKPTVSALVETETIYHKEQMKPEALKLRGGIDWKWKERYFISYMYMQSVVQANLGFTDDQLQNYYDTHKSEFSTTTTKDSAGKSQTITVASPFADVKNQVADKMFLAEYKPDSGFIASAPEKDTAGISARWLNYMRQGGCRDYFLNVYYKKTYGTQLPDSLKDFCGKGKIITQEDLDLILTWLPADRRDEYKNNPAGLRDLALWLVRWKVFAQKALDVGYDKQPEVRNVLSWAWHFQVAQNYVSTKLVEQAKQGIVIDSAMALYSWRDESNSIADPDTGRLHDHFTRLIREQMNVKMDSLVYELRKHEEVRFVKQDWSDDLQKDPAAILKTADSLRDTGNTSGAQVAYSTLIDNFLFSKAGRQALLERAKIRTEQQLYTDAIRDYRRALVLDVDRAKECNTMFMIGFIYDEYLNNPEMAEVNYKWVLKNTPKCELADDAEFMMLHLGEQMASVNELQAEVKRQGKKVDESAPADSSGLKVETEQAKQKKG